MLLLQALSFILLTVESIAVCGDNVRWSQRFVEDNIFGMWFTVGLVQHTPELLNGAESVCVTLFISDVTGYLPQEVAGAYDLANSRNYRMRNNLNDMLLMSDHRLQVVRVENDWTEIQTYTYAKEAPALWTLEQWRPGELEMLTRRTDIIHTEDPQKRAQHIHVLNSTPDVLILYHCADEGAYTLILRRKPAKLNKWEWTEIKQMLRDYDISWIYEKTQVCALATRWMSSIILMSTSAALCKLL